MLLVSPGGWHTSLLFIRGQPDNSARHRHHVDCIYSNHLFEREKPVKLTCIIYITCMPTRFSRRDAPTSDVCVYCCTRNYSFLLPGSNMHEGKPQKSKRESYKGNWMSNRSSSNSTDQLCALCKCHIITTRNSEIVWGAEEVESSQIK